MPKRYQNVIKRRIAWHQPCTPRWHAFISKEWRNDPRAIDSICGRAAALSERVRIVNSNPRFWWSKWDRAQWEIPEDLGEVCVHCARLLGIPDHPRYPERTKTLANLSGEPVSSEEGTNGDPERARGPART
jgi:hypothetical protein